MAKETEESTEEIQKAAEREARIKHVMGEAYKNLFGAKNDKEAQKKMEAQVKELSKKYRKIFAKYGREEAIERFEDAYSSFCEKWLKKAWTQNHEIRLHGYHAKFEGTLTRNSAQVTDEFMEYMRDINARLREQGIVNLPNVDKIIAEGVQTDIDDDAPTWKEEWDRDVLSKRPQDKIGMMQVKLYDFDPLTGKEPSVKRALELAEMWMKVACKNKFGLDTSAEQGVEVVSILRAVEQKHESRSIFWKMLHPIDNYRESKAIESLHKIIRTHIEKGNLDEEAINAVDAEVLKVDWLEEERKQYLLPQNLNEMKKEAFETKEEAARRANKEKNAEREEKEELARIAEELKPVAEAEEFLSGAAEADEVEAAIARGDENYRKSKGNTFEEMLDEERKEFDERANGYDFSDDKLDDIEALFVPEAEESAKRVSSESSKEVDAPVLSRDLK